MPINFSDAVINIGQSQGFDWGAALASAFGAFIGAGFAFLLNILHENKKVKSKNITNLNALIQALTTEFVDLINIDNKIKEIKENWTNIRNKVEKGETINVIPKIIIKQSIDEQKLPNVKFIIKNTKSLFVRLLKLFMLLRTIEIMINTYNKVVVEQKKLNIDSLDALISQLDEILKFKNKLIIEFKFVILNLDLYLKEYFNEYLQELLFTKEEWDIYNSIPVTIDVKPNKSPMGIICKFRAKINK